MVINEFMKPFLKPALSLLLLIGFGFFFFQKMKKETGRMINDGIAQEFSGIVSSKGTQRGGLWFSFQSGQVFSKHTLDPEMDSISPGDSVIKKKGENSCTIYKRDGRVLKVKFVYINAMYK